MAVPRVTQVDSRRELRPEFGPYLAMMDFLGALLGPRSEIVLHDTSDLSRSVVALTHGYVSGRSLGAPATDLVLKVLRNHEHDDVDYLANYPAESAAGGRFRSSTYFIRDAGDQVVGLLCVNIDDTSLIAVRDLLTELTATADFAKGTAPSSRLSPVARDGTSRDGASGDGASDDRASGDGVRTVVERLSITVDDLTLDGVSRIVAAKGLSPHRMTAEERIDAVRDLDAAGMFLLKGAVARAAASLEVSEPTIYRYLRVVRTEA